MTAEEISRNMNCLSSDELCEAAKIAVMRLDALARTAAIRLEMNPGSLLYRDRLDLITQTFDEIRNRVEKTIGGQDEGSRFIL